MSHLRFLPQKALFETTTIAAIGKILVDSENGKIFFTVQGDVYSSDLQGKQTPISLSSQEVLHKDNGKTVDLQ